MSLQANAAHGKRREPSDYRRAYQIAVRYKLVGATDSAAVQGLLCCSGTWARNLTAKAREKQIAARDEKIKAKKAEGKTVRQVADETGVGLATVDRVLKDKPKKKRGKAASGVPQRHSVNSEHAIEADPTDPRQTDIEEFLADPTPSGVDIARAKLTEMETPRAQRWHKAHETGVSAATVDCVLKGKPKGTTSDPAARCTASPAVSAPGRGSRHRRGR